MLSSSAIRGLLRAETPTTARFEQELVLPDDFFKGAELRRLGDDDTVAVVASEGASGRLTLAAPLAIGAAGEPAELVFPVAAPILAARAVTGTATGQPLPALAMRLATTRGTNALLERRGVPVAFFVTAGFADLLLIGNQQRSDLFALSIEKRQPLYAAVVEVDERLAADGSMVRALDLAALEPEARALLAAGIDSAAVALVNAYRCPDHELAIAAALRQWGFGHVSLSAQLAPRIQILPRAETAVANAYLSSVIEGYLADVQTSIGDGTLQVMTSAGGLVGAASYTPKDSLLSGPAAGVVGAAAAARRSGVERLIGFDMGGTSTDVSRYAGALDYSSTTEVGGARLMVPGLAIETVAAGGGSCCRIDGSTVSVGPDSAGASPGPAAYGAGGPLTLTDVNLLLGRLQPSRFAIPLDVAAAENAARRLVAELASAGETVVLEQLLVGLLAIADERMAEAIRRISTRRGYALAEHALVAFGGAGGQHACAVASLLGIATVLVPADAGILSARGLSAARLERYAERSLLAPLSAVETKLEGIFSALAKEAVAAVSVEGVEPSAVRIVARTMELRVAGQEATLALDWPPAEGAATAAFAARYRQLYGYPPPAVPLEVESVRLVAGSEAEDSESPPVMPEARPAVATGERRSWTAGSWAPWPIYERETLAPGSFFDGPALVTEAHSTTVVATGWRAAIDGAAALVLIRVAGG